MSTEIVEYSKTDAALADLASRFKGVVFEVATREGMGAAVKARAEVRGYRVDLEKTRVEIKAAFPEYIEKYRRMAAGLPGTEA